MSPPAGPHRLTGQATHPTTENPPPPHTHTHIQTQRTHTHAHAQRCPHPSKHPRAAAHTDMKNVAVVSSGNSRKVSFVNWTYGLGSTARGASAWLSSAVGSPGAASSAGEQFCTHRSCGKPAEQHGPEATTCWLAPTTPRWPEALENRATCCFCGCSLGDPARAHVPVNLRLLQPELPAGRLWDKPGALPRQTGGAEGRAAQCSKTLGTRRLIAPAAHQGHHLCHLT
jgi:hypothetical protein